MTIANNKIVQAMGIIAGACITLDVILICANIIGRTAGHPIFGTYEMVGWTTAIATGFGVAYTQAHRGHVAIDNLTSILPKRWQFVSEVTVYMLSIVTFGLASWKLFEYARNAHHSGSSSISLHFHYYPIVYMVSLAMICMTIILLAQLYGAIKQHAHQPTSH